MAKKKDREKTRSVDQILDDLLVKGQISTKEAQTIRSATVGGLIARSVERFLRGDKPKLDFSSVDAILRRAVEKATRDDSFPFSDKGKVINPFGAETQDAWRDFAGYRKAWSQIEERWPVTSDVVRPNHFSVYAPFDDDKKDVDIYLKGEGLPTYDEALFAVSTAISWASVLAEPQKLRLHMSSKKGDFHQISVPNLGSEQDPDPAMVMMTDYLELLESRPD